MKDPIFLVYDHHCEEVEEPNDIIYLTDEMHKKMPVNLKDMLVEFGQTIANAYHSGQPVVSFSAEIKSKLEPLEQELISFLENFDECYYEPLLLNLSMGDEFYYALGRKPPPKPVFGKPFRRET